MRRKIIINNIFRNNKHPFFFNNMVIHKQNYFTPTKTGNEKWASLTCVGNETKIVTEFLGNCPLKMTVLESILSLRILTKQNKKIKNITYLSCKVLIHKT